MKRTLSLFLVIIMLLFVTTALLSCGEKPITEATIKEQMIGRWESTISGLTVYYDFKSTNSFDVVNPSTNGVLFTGSYSINLDENKVDMTFFEENIEITMNYEYSGDSFKLSDTSGTLVKIK